MSIGRQSRTASPGPRSPIPGPVVTVSYGLPRTGLPASSSFRRWIDTALAGARHRRAAEVSIRLVAEDEGRVLNRDYRGRDYATNVLSFPAELPAEIQLPLLGDLAFCAPVVASEAEVQGKLLQHHYAHLTVHGVLHLLGFDHTSNAGATRMERLETQILAGMGIADPYA